MRLRKLVLGWVILLGAAGMCGRIGYELDQVKPGRINRLRQEVGYKDRWKVENAYHTDLAGDQDSKDNDIILELKDGSRLLYDGTTSYKLIERQKPQE